ncbi:MAG: TetR/AcrR family transcriptional regulator [Corticimicrobacter sp.]|uniref:TetR/AcrR family transcriptional regulator n=1 Tax=Corticimicrobacter sp. TaxID=2678536 RepID=UPI0032DBADFD
MKVSKAQAQENRQRVVEAASLLFRERGYDGVGVVELMAAAGLTHGGFYKQFSSKAALMAESAACGFSQSVRQLEGVDIAQFVENYLSRAHRDVRGPGCTIAGLGGDAARQDDDIKREFGNGIEALVQALGDMLAGQGAPHDRARILALIAQVVGALVLSRACPDTSALSEEILVACRQQVMTQMQNTQA